MKRKTRDSEFINENSEEETEYNNEETYDAGVIDQESSDSYEEETETDSNESYVNVNPSMTLEIYRDNQKLWEERLEMIKDHYENKTRIQYYESNSIQKFILKSLIATSVVCMYSMLITEQIYNMKNRIHICSAYK